MSSARTLTLRNLQTVQRRVYQHYNAVRDAHSRADSALIALRTDPVKDAARPFLTQTKALVDLLDAEQVRAVAEYNDLGRQQAEVWESMTPQERVEL